MSDEPAQAKSLTSLEFDDEGILRSFPEVVIRAREIDQVRVVGDDRADRRGLPGIFPFCDGLVGNRTGIPLIWALGEDLKSVTADRLSSSESPVEPSSDRDVSTEFRHRFSLPS